MNIEQEIRAQIEKNKGLKLAVGEINNHLSILEGLLRNERDDVQKQVNEAYQRGLDDAWECMKKIAFLEKPRDMRDFLGHTTFGGILTGYTAAEAIAKLKAYEEKQKAEDDIKLGDELEHTVSGYTSKAIFLEKNGDDEDWYNCLFWTGCGVAILSYPKSQFKRTGKHFDIDKILAEMRT